MLCFIGQLCYCFFIYLNNIFHLFYTISENLTVTKKHANYISENSSFERVQWPSQREGRPHREKATFSHCVCVLCFVVSLSIPDLSLVFICVCFSPSELFFLNSLTYAHRERSSQTPSCPVFHISRDNAAFS